MARKERKHKKMARNTGLRVKALALLMTMLFSCGILSACQTAEVFAPADGAAGLSDEQLAKLAAGILYTAFGVEVATEDLIVPEDLGLDPVICITAGGPVEEGEVRRYCHVFLNRETGAFEGASRDLAPQAKSPDEAPPLDEMEARHDKKKLAKTALEKLAALTGAAPKAYHLGGVEALLDAEDSIITDCHILLENGDYYIVSVVCPGNLLYRIDRAPAGEPFVELDTLTKDSFGGEWSVF